MQPKKWQQGVLVNKILVENAQANENRELIFEKKQPSKHSVFSEIAKSRETLRNTCLVNSARLSAHRITDSKVDTVFILSAIVSFHFLFYPI